MISSVIFSKSSLMNSERKQRGMLCRAGELYNPGKALPAMSRFQYYEPHIFWPGFVFILRVAFAFLARRNFKVRKLFVGVIFPRKLTMPHSHRIQEECCDHICNLTFAFFRLHLPKFAYQFPFLACIQMDPLARDCCVQIEICVSLDTRAHSGYNTDCECLKQPNPASINVDIVLWVCASLIEMSLWPFTTHYLA